MEKDVQQFASRESSIDSVLKAEDGIKPFDLPISDAQMKEFNSFSKFKSILDEIREREKHSEQIDDLLSSLLNIYQEQLVMEQKKCLECIRKRKQLNRDFKIGRDSKEQRESLQAFDQEIEKFNIHMNVLNNLINYLKHSLRNLSHENKKVAHVEFQDEVEITVEQKVFAEHLLECSNFSYYSLKDCLYALGYFIKYGMIQDELLSRAREIANTCIYEEIEEDKIIDGVHYVWDSLKYRLSKEDKEKNQKEREVLRNIRILFDFVLKNYQEDQPVIRHNYLFSIVNFLIEDEECFLYLKKLVQQLPSIVNLYHSVIQDGKKTQEHIVLYLVHKFIENYKIMLQTKNNSYINIDYLRSIYFLFTRDYHLHLTKEEKEKIDFSLRQFEIDIDRSLTSSKRKNRVKEDLAGMYTEYFYFRDKEYFERDIDDDRLERQINSFSFRMNMMKKDINRVDLREEQVISFSPSYHAYSLEKTNQQLILKIHTLDLYGLFLPNSDIEHYLFNQTLKKEELDSIFSHVLEMKKQGEYPVITYEISYSHSKNGRLTREPLKIYQSLVHIKWDDRDLNLSDSKKDFFLTPYLDLYRSLNSKDSTNYDINTLDCCFERELNHSITEFFETHHFPFIYGGVGFFSEEKNIDLMNHVGYLLSRISSHEFEVVYQVLNSNVDEFHYSTSSFLGEYQLAIINPNNYVALSLQRLIHELIIDNKNTEREFQRCIEKYQNQFEDFVSVFNYYHDYVDAKVLEANKGRLVKQKKMI